ncbi:MAG TPA: hypothetical protein VGI58_17800 [Streptosporangiaceae bacterium]
MSTARRMTGHLSVDLRPGEAFQLFTPRGEQDWSHGWHPHFPTSVDDDTKPGVVFETHGHGRPTIWLVTECETGLRIAYARVTPGHLAGTVTVAISSRGAASDVEVTYQLTALASAADDELSEFADGYPAYLHSWHDAIAALLRRRRTEQAAMVAGNPASEPSHT